MLTLTKINIFVLSETLSDALKFVFAQYVIKDLLHPRMMIHKIPRTFVKG